MDVREKASNEKRLIDYDEIRSLFSSQYKETVRLIHNGETHLDNLAEGFTEADRIIRKIPTVDAVEVVHGRWETNSDRPDSLICSICKCGFDMWKHDPHNYCPNCGADMRGSNDE